MKFIEWTEFKMTEWMNEFHQNKNKFKKKNDYTQYAFEFEICLHTIIE